MCSKYAEFAAQSSGTVHHPRMWCCRGYFWQVVVLLDGDDTAVSRSMATGVGCVKPLPIGAEPHGVRWLLRSPSSDGPLPCLQVSLPHAVDRNVWVVRVRARVIRCARHHLLTITRAVLLDSPPDWQNPLASEADLHKCAAVLSVGAC